jgi:hypothetical protein
MSAMRKETPVRGHKQTRITPKATSFKPRNPPPPKPRIAVKDIVWVDNDGTAYGMDEITNTHLVSIVSMIDRGLASMRASAEKADNLHELVASKEYVKHSDKLMAFMLELAVRGVPYSDVPRKE